MKIFRLISLFLLLICVKGISQPVVTSFSPTSAVVGATITISGKNFSTNPTNNIVSFGNVTGSVVSATATYLSVTVPKGASYSQITVSVNNLTGYSSGFFTPTFTSCTNDSLTFVATDSVYKTVPYWDASNSDLNGDGKPEILSTNGDTIFILMNVSTLLNDSFTKISFTTSTSFTPITVAIADFDGDGKPDIISYNSSATFAIFKNTGTNSTISFGKEIDFNLDTISIQDINVADFDGDGKPDLIITVFNNKGGQELIWVLRNTSIGKKISFAKPVALSIGSQGLSPTIPFNVYFSQAKVGDFNGDGKVDIAVNYAYYDFESGGYAISLFTNTSTKNNISFDSAATIVALANANFGTGPVGTQSLVFSIGDMNGDGKIDIVYASTNLFAIGGAAPYYYFDMLENTSSSSNISFKSIGPPSIYEVQPNGWQITSPSIQVADMDGDGKPDIMGGSQIFLNGCTLPVTLLDFSAKTIGKQIAINWQTSTELNTANFIIQRSTDGSTFTDIGTVKAIGSGANSYSFTDKTPTNGINYYRLKSVDKDGSLSFSKIVSASLTTNNYLSQPCKR